MKKNIFILLALMFSMECIAGGVLKWKLKLSFKTDTVWVGEFDIINKKIVDFTMETTKSTKGNYDIQEPCIIGFVVTDTKTKIKKSYVCPAIPGEEVVITDKNDGRYDFDGSDFYKKFHDIDLYIENLKNHKDNIYSDFESYIKEHSNEETCAMMIPIALDDKEQIKSAASLLSPQLKNSRMKSFVDYLFNQQEISRYAILSFKEMCSLNNMKQLKIVGVKLNMEGCFRGYRELGSCLLELKNKPDESVADQAPWYYIGMDYYPNKYDPNRIFCLTCAKKIGDMVISNRALQKDAHGLFYFKFEKPLYIEWIECGDKERPVDNFLVFVEKTKEIETFLIKKEEAEKRRKEAEEKEARERERIAKELEEAKKKLETEAELAKQKEAKVKKEWDKTVDNLREEMNKKYGKKWVDLADQGDIQVGMHEDLVAFVCNFYGIELKATYETKTFKTYDLYALRSVKTGYRESTIKSIWIGSVRIQNHKVVSITRGERWSK